MFQRTQHTSGHQPNSNGQAKKPLVLQRKGENNFQHNADGKITGMRPNDKVPPEEQEKLKTDFEIFATHNIKLINNNADLNEESRNEKLAEFKKKKEKFLKKMGGDELKHWGSNKYTKLKDKYFSNYDTVIKDKKEEVRDDALAKIKKAQESIGNITPLLEKAISDSNQEVGKAQPYLDAAQKELDNAVVSKNSAEEKLTGYSDGVKTGHLAVFDEVLEQLQIVVNNTASRIGALNQQSADYNNYISSLNGLSAKLDDFTAKFTSENDVQALILLGDDSAFLSILSEVSDVVEKSRPDQSQQLEGNEYDVKSLDVYKAKLGAEHEAIDARVAAQPNTKDLTTLTQEQIHELAATAYAEGANQGYSLRKIVWVYINNVRTYKYRTAMSWSVAYNEKQWLFKKFMYVTGQGDQYKNDICYSGKTFGELFVKGEPDAIMTQLLDFTNLYVGETAQDVPARFSSLESQGYYNDMNLNYSTGYKAKWHKARLYLLHKLKNKVPSEDYSRYMQVVGTHENLTFLYDQYHIQDYLEQQYPGGIPAPANIKTLKKKNNQWYLDGKKVNATTD